MEIAFTLNGTPVRVTADPSRTLLDWLREDRGLTGTKEGCNEGDCGACTVLVADERGPRAVNACLLFLPQIAGKSVRTVEGLASPEGALHPVQQALIDHHGSQCGFCTPGIAVALAAAHAEGRADHDAVLAGNLCRCTGYAPIVRAAETAEAAAVPAFLRAELSAASRGAAPPATDLAPRTSDELAALYAAHPEATLIAGGTDVALRVTKALEDLPRPIFLGGIGELRRIDVSDGQLRLGATVTLEEMRRAVADRIPGLAALIGRFASLQIRNVATVGGNIANGSPIGDLPPALIALGATLHLRRADERRTLPLEAFFLGYRRQDRRPGEFVEAVSLPADAPLLRCHKLSKRFDQDISTVLGCFHLTVEDGRVTRARIAFGGMAATPLRARALEAALLGGPLTLEAARDALPALAEDFTPLSDHRGSAEYRLRAAGGLLLRHVQDLAGVPVRVREVLP